ncbi:MAG TPA: radical SAM protein [Vicinamibacterales bacterium]|nr:radical SAM protein [Vicinamibacterales bacterium]
MRVLLLSMPDAFEHMPPIAIRMPNGAIVSLAGNVDPHHRVVTADLVLVPQRVRETVSALLREHQPDVAGLSVMTFQRRTALKIAALIREQRPSAAIVVGGYDPSLAPEAYADPALPIDVIVRGEGDVTLRELLRAIESGTGLGGVRGVWWRDGDRFVANPARPVSPASAIRPPDRGSRVLHGYTLLGRQVDVVETSRGCTFDCSFCSIVEMRGRNFHPFPIDRVLADIADARARGARAIFLVDDNIMLDVKRFAELCRAIVDHRLNDVRYVVQAMTSSLANHGEELAPLMRRANFRYVFLGIENVIDEDLAFLRARAKNRERATGGNASLRATALVRRHGMYVVGGLIIGNPGDTAESIEANLGFARAHVDWPYIQHPTPYPGTPMTQDLRAQNLIAHDRVHEYDGTTSVVVNGALDAEEIEFRRWRAERWMKVRHFPRALRDNPAFVLRHARSMFAHTFRGCTWKTLLGLEDEREAFRRYKQMREGEREYL